METGTQTRWMYEKPLVEGVYGHEMVFYNGMAYVIGGTKYGVTNKIYSYDNNMKRWRLVGHLRKKRRFFSAVIV